MYFCALVKFLNLLFHICILTVICPSLFVPLSDITACVLSCVSSLVVVLWPQLLQFWRMSGLSATQILPKGLCSHLPAILNPSCLLQTIHSCLFCFQLVFHTFFPYLFLKYFSSISSGYLSVSPQRPNLTALFLFFLTVDL